MLCLGSFSGNFAQSAYGIGLVHGVLQGMLGSSKSAGDAMATANRIMVRDFPVYYFASLFLGLLDLESCEFRYVSAGHTAQLLLDAEGGCTSLAANGPALGVLADAAYELSAPHRLGSGSRMLLFSEELHEAYNGRGEMYGEERLMGSARF
ncbi:MAG: PP2C family protein-serine/threonine phosphatase, partial [Planctomycetota bacterium]|nr:PP2C family protein-serine/threonine phosphatase [Planctomycetota bacterium]